MGQYLVTNDELQAYKDMSGQWHPYRHVLEDEYTSPEVPPDVIEASLAGEAELKAHLHARLNELALAYGSLTNQVQAFQTNYVQMMEAIWYKSNSEKDKGIELDGFEIEQAKIPAVSGAAGLCSPAAAGGREQGQPGASPPDMGVQKDTDWKITAAPITAPWEKPTGVPPAADPRTKITAGPASRQQQQQPVLLTVPAFAQGVNNLALPHQSPPHATPSPPESGYWSYMEHTGMMSKQQCKLEDLRAAAEQGKIPWGATVCRSSDGLCLPLTKVGCNSNLLPLFFACLSHISAATCLPCTVG